ncbi:class I SAM-dependent methyltransferase [Thermodesulfobacteriota bacterium]
MKKAWPVMLEVNVVADLIQRDSFLSDEADAWFRRNHSQLMAESEIRDLVTTRITMNKPGPDVLEIGCGDGANLAALAKKTNIHGYGLEPSPEAIKHGKSRFPFIFFKRGVADAIPWQNDSFDVVWFGFCLYLIDRELLFKVVAEADRVLRIGGDVGHH